jgi:hypothetical protein
LGNTEAKVEVPARQGGVAAHHGAGSCRWRRTTRRGDHDPNRHVSPHFGLLSLRLTRLVVRADHACDTAQRRDESKAAAVKYRVGARRISWTSIRAQTGRRTYIWHGWPH